MSIENLDERIARAKANGPKPVVDASQADAYNGVTTGRGHLTGKRDSVQANIKQVLADKEVNAVAALQRGGADAHDRDSCRR